MNKQRVVVLFITLGCVIQLANADTRSPPHDAQSLTRPHTTLLKPKTNPFVAAINNVYSHLDKIEAEEKELRDTISNAQLSTSMPLTRRQIAQSRHYEAKANLLAAQKRIRLEHLKMLETQYLKSLEP